MKYKCINKECKEFNIEKSVNMHKIFNKDGSILDKNLQCPECLKDRKIIMENNGLSLITHGRGNVPNK